MSPQRKKGRGGGGGKTVAPNSCPAMDSPNPLIPFKLSRERRALTAQQIAAGKSKQQKEESIRVLAAEQARVSAAEQARVSATESAMVPAAENTRVSYTERARARASSAIKARISAAESVRVSAASSRSVPAAAGEGSSSSIEASKRANAKARAESRPRSGRASPNLSVHRKGPPERLARNEPSKTAFVSLGRTSGNTREGKKLSRVSGTFHGSVLEKEECTKDFGVSGKVDPSIVEKVSGREPSRSGRIISQKENLPECMRWSTTALPLPVQRKGTLVDMGRTEVARPKLGLAKQDALQEGRFSTGSSMISMTNISKFSRENGLQKHDNSRVEAKCGNQQGVPKESKVIAPSSTHDASIHQAPDGVCLSSSLHRRLALLEGKVSQIAAELKKTKKMLDSNDCAGSIALLFDIQDKISSIERAWAPRESDEEAASLDDVIMEDEFQVISTQRSVDSVQECRASFESFTTQKDLHSLQFSMASEHEMFSKHTILQGSTSAPPRVSGLAYDQQDLEDRLFPHRKLLKSRLSLNEKDAESRTLRTKLEDTVTQRQIEGLKNDHRDDGKSKVSTSLEQLPCTEKISPLAEVSTEAVHTGKNSEDLCNSSLKDENTRLMRFQGKWNSESAPLQSSISMSGFANQNLKQPEVNTVNSVPVIEGHGHIEEACAQVPGIYVENTKDILECDESPPSNSFLENLENIAPDDGVELYYDDCLPNQLHSFADKVATTGWYVSEGEAILLAHDDGCCSYYDVANMEEKAVYEAPDEISAPLWNDCWLIRAAGADGRSNKYIVAATAGSALDCGFCSWDFYTKALAACHSEYQSTPPNGSAQSSPINVSLSTQLLPSRSTMCMPLSDGRVSQHWRASGDLADAGISASLLHNSASTYQTECCESPRWWYKPCGPLMASAASSLRSVVLYDIRDGEAVMSWDTNRPVVSLDYSSPLQWRDKGKLALAEQQGISVWDVNTMDVHCLQYIELPGKQISAFHLHNSDAECSGGIRQRLSSSEMEAYDGVCCTQNNINILDFRVPKGIGICFSVPGQDLQSVFARGDMILTGGLNRGSHECSVQQWSVRKAMPVCTYAFPASNSHYTQLSLTQVWGSSGMVMAVNGNGLYIFKGWKEAAEGLCDVEEVKDVVGPQDLFNPSFDYSNSRVLLISRDRQAAWSYWPQ